jgi:hypothetical protein
MRESHEFHDSRKRSLPGTRTSSVRIEQSSPPQFRVSADETRDIGEDTRTPITRDYQVPFRSSRPAEPVALMCDFKFPSDVTPRR